MCLVLGLFSAQGTGCRVGNPQGLLTGAPEAGAGSGLPLSSDTTPAGPLLRSEAKQHFLAKRWCGGEGSAVRVCPSAQLGHPWARDAMHAPAEHPSWPQLLWNQAVERASREKAATLLELPPLPVPPG